VTFSGEMNFPRFTQWLGANSSARKQARIVGEINTKLLAAGVVCDRQNLRLQYLPTLRMALTQPLVTQGADGIDAVVDVMQSYLISRCATACACALCACVIS
jgi:replication factor C subunit 1